VISVSPRVRRGPSPMSGQLATQGTHRPPPCLYRSCHTAVPLPLASRGPFPLAARCRSLRPRPAAPPRSLPRRSTGSFQALLWQPRLALASRRPPAATVSPALYHAQPPDLTFLAHGLRRAHNTIGHPAPSVPHARPATPPSTPVPQHPGPRPPARPVRNSHLRAHPQGPVPAPPQDATPGPRPPAGPAPAHHVPEAPRAGRPRLSSALVVTHDLLTLVPLCPERISVIADPYFCRISAASPPA
jgi:hypothetical protein